MRECTLFSKRIAYFRGIFAADSSREMTESRFEYLRESSSESNANKS